MVALRGSIPLPLVKAKDLIKRIGSIVEELDGVNDDASEDDVVQVKGFLDVVMSFGSLGLFLERERMWKKGPLLEALNDIYLPTKKMLNEVEEDDIDYNRYWLR